MLRWLNVQHPQCLVSFGFPHYTSCCYLSHLILVSFVRSPLDFPFGGKPLTQTYALSRTTGSPNIRNTSVGIARSQLGFISEHRVVRRVLLPSLPSKGARLRTIGDDFPPRNIASKGWCLFSQGGKRPYWVKQLSVPKTITITKTIMTGGIGQIYRSETDQRS